MKVKTLFIILTILLFSFCDNSNDFAFDNKDGKVHHFEFLRNHELNNKSKSFLEKGKLDNALELAKQIECYDLMCRFKNVLIAEIFLARNDKAQAIKYLKKAIEQGHSKKYVDYGFNTFGQLNEIYESQYSIYESKIDHKLRRKIIECVGNDQSSRDTRDWKRMTKVDSINQAFLDSITRNSGWPGVDKIGHNSNIDQTDPTILVLHMDSLKKYNYLKKIKLSCSNNKTEWWKATSVFTNLFNRNRDKDNCFGTNDLFYNNRGEILKNKSSFFTESITKTIIRNKQQIIIRPGQNLDPSIRENVLNNLKQIIINKGVKAEDIRLDINPPENYLIKPYSITIQPIAK